MRPTPGIGGRAVNTDIDGSLYAGRGIYRPAQTVHLSALLRDLQSHASRTARARW